MLASRGGGGPSSYVINTPARWLVASFANMMTGHDRDGPDSFDVFKMAALHLGYKCDSTCTEGQIHIRLGDMAVMHTLLLSEPSEHCLLLLHAAAVALKRMPCDTKPEQHSRYDSDQEQYKEYMASESLTSSTGTWHGGN